MVAICDCFSVLGGLLIVPVGGGGTLRAVSKVES